MAAGGSQVARQWVVVLLNGEIVIDWGDGLAQSTRSGEFFHIKEGEISHNITDDELRWLKQIGRVLDFDSVQVSFPVLPDRPVDLMQ